MIAPPPAPDDVDAVAAALEAGLSSSTVQRDRTLGDLTTYRVGGAASVFVDLADHDDLEALVRITSTSMVPILIVGRGSNLLVADAGFPGLAVRLGDGFTAIEPIDDGVVDVGGAASLPSAARRLTSDGWTGFEWAVGVPGSIGGAVRMNAGGHGSDMAASVTSATIVDLRRGLSERVDAAGLEFGYRRSSVASAHLVVDARLRLEPGDADQGGAEITEIVRWRREHQPGGQNAGSVFTNPADDSAGRLIDVAGLKGLRVGTAEVSEKHANFIQADPGGSADDIAALMAEIRRRVAAAAGLWLHAETRMVGFDTDVLEASGGLDR